MVIRGGWYYSGSGGGWGGVAVEEDSPAVAEVSAVVAAAGKLVVKFLPFLHSFTKAYFCGYSPLEHMAQKDKVVFDLIEKEKYRQQSGIELIASRELCLRASP